MIIKFEIQRVIDGELPAKIDEELSLELQKFNLDIKKDDFRCRNFGIHTFLSNFIFDKHGCPLHFKRCY